MEVLLKNNLFVFEDQLYSQEVGAPMGGPAVPDYANIFMAKKIDKGIREILTRNQALKLFKRFLDDIFIIFCGSTRDLHSLFKEINAINSSIQLTMSHTSVPGEDPLEKCECETKESIPFLDTLCSLKDGKVETTLYRKDTDRNQYLLPSSCHPRQTTRSIPYSLATRIVRICSNTQDREKELEKLKKLLSERDYNSDTINRAIERAKAVPRLQLLKPKTKQQTNERPVFAVRYDPRLPSIPASQAKHWRSMVNRDQHLKEVFPVPPLTGYKRQRNLRDMLVRAKVPEN